MKTILLFALVFFPINVSIANSDWSNPITMKGRGSGISQDIPPTEFIEVPASKRDIAERWLSSVQYKILDKSKINYIGISSLQCDAPNNVYLVRALFVNGETGSFFVSRFDSNLLVSFESLGANASGEKKTAIAVCLSFQPEEVFVQAGGGAL